MNQTRKPTSPHWQPGENFWLWHLWIPLAAAVVVLYGIEQTGFDMWLARQWFALEGGEWAWRNNWISYELIHHHGKQGIIAIGLTALGLIIGSFFLQRFRYWRMPMSYLLATMALVPAAIAYFKHYSPVHCPWSLVEFGGDQPYVRTFDHFFMATDMGHCFPSGHASGGFILLAMYFAALPFARRPARFLVPGIIVGVIFALGQQSRGAHFLSHDLWTLTICWFGALFMFLAFRPGRWPHPAPHDDRVEHPSQVNSRAIRSDRKPLRAPPEAPVPIGVSSRS
jgi:membrane-associated PAP2 superfamily phosphatase